MENSLATVALIVKDYEEAKNFYINKVGFHLVMDDNKGDDLRFLVISPSNSSKGAGILLSKAHEGTESIIGSQFGGKVGLFLSTNDFNLQYQRMKENGVVFLEEPRDEPYGKVVVWQDLYGNKWDLIQNK